MLICYRQNIVRDVVSVLKSRSRDGLERTFDMSRCRKNLGRSWSPLRLKARSLGLVSVSDFKVSFTSLLVVYKILCVGEFWRLQWSKLYVARAN